RECGKEISREAAACPGCGVPEPSADPRAIEYRKSAAEISRQTWNDFWARTVAVTLLSGVAICGFTSSDSMALLWLMIVLAAVIGFVYLQGKSYDARADELHREIFGEPL